MTDPLDPLQQTRTRMNPKWFRKFMIFVLVLLGFGVWALLDAAWLYPDRGSRAAEHLEYQYLDALRSARGGALDNLAASIPDPVERLARLEQTKREGGALPGSDGLLLQWLEQLKLVGQLNPESTTFPRTDFRGEQVASAQARFETLRDRWTRADGNAPKSSPLAFYDIPSQWLILIVCWGIMACMLITLVRVRARVYRWDPARRQLTLPTGQSFTPEDLADVDWRLWHKYYSSVTLRDGHPTLSGRSIEFDFLRFLPLEEWVKAMARERFPDRPPPGDDKKSAPAPNNTPEPAPAEAVEAPR